MQQDVDKWRKAAETATANANMWMDEAIAQRERADRAEEWAKTCQREKAEWETNAEELRLEIERARHE